LAINTRGQVWGHAAAVNAISVAAVNAQGVTSPFVGGAANPVETFSSDGPRRIFYKADGTPITPDNFLDGGGVVRPKPNIAAADGVMTTLPSNTGLNPFFGTSAAAPHAAAVAALLKSFRPSLTPAQTRIILNQTALDIEATGVDQDSGHGIVMADRALQRAAESRRVSP
jgi:subtilisin family serine protease